MQDNRGKKVKKSIESHKQHSALHAMWTVLWSFFWERRNIETQADIQRLTMTQIIVTAIFGAVLFVMMVLLLVYFVTK
jgi:hypothetical protein